MTLRLHRGGVRSPAAENLSAAPALSLPPRVSSLSLEAWAIALAGTPDVQSRHAPGPLGLSPGHRTGPLARSASRLGALGGPRWQLALPGGVSTVHTAYVGVQRHSPAESSMRAATAAANVMREVLQASGAAAIEAFDVVAGHDMPGARVQVASWSDPEVAAQGMARLDLTALYASLGDWRHSVGLWVEEFTTPVARLETAYGGPDPLRRRPGLASLPNTLAVWGEAAVLPPIEQPWRSTVPDTSFDSGLDALGGGHEVPFGYGECVSGYNLDELVHVRSGYDWRDCGEVESRMGERGLKLLVDLGLDHLWSHPVETGAYGLRQLVRVDREGTALADVGFAGFMRSQSDVARWNDEQMAHMADFQRLLDQEGLPASERWLRSHQEVATLAPGDAHFEYVNCGPRTGVIRFLELGRARLRVRHDLD